MSTKSVSSDSPLQLPQLVEDQLSEDELETVVGGVLYVVSCPAYEPLYEPLPVSVSSGVGVTVSTAEGGNPRLLIPQVFPQVLLHPGGPRGGVGGGIKG